MDEFKYHAGINIFNSKFQILEVKKEEENFEIININESFFNKPLDFLAEKDTIITSELQTAFDRIQLKQSLKSSSLSFSLPQEIFYTVQLPYENTLSHNDLINELRWELSLLYPFVDSKELVIGYFKIDRNNFNTKNSVFVIAIEKKHIKHIKDFCAKNSLSLKYIDNALIAANRLLNSKKDIVNKGLVLNIICSRNSISTTLNLKGKPFYIKTFTLSRSDKVTDILANELSTAFFKQVKPELNDVAYISGEEITAELISQLRIISGLSFKQLNPFKDVAVKTDIQNRRLIEEKYSSFTSAAGMAFRLA